MAKLKILAKSHMLSKNVPILCAFIACVSALIFFGNLSVFASYAANLYLEENIRPTAVFISAILGILLLPTFFAPLHFGAQRWFFLNARGDDPDLRELFFYFQKGKFLKCISAFLYISSIKIAALTLFFFPAMCLSAVMWYCVMYNSTAFAIILALGIADSLLILAGAVFYLVYTGGFVLFIPLTVLDEKLTFSDALSKSREHTSPVLFKIFIFRLSFAPWWLLCLLIFPTFYIWGYYRQAMAEFANTNIVKYVENDID